MDLRRFAFSTSTLCHVPLSRALAQISSAGFKNVQLCADGPHLWLDRFSPADVSALSKQLDKLGLNVVGIDAIHGNGFWSDASPEPVFEPSLISSDRRLREWRIAYVKKALRLARELDAPGVTVVSGRLLNGMTPAAAQKLLEEGLLRLLEHAESLNRNLVLACRPGLFVESHAEIKAIVERIKMPHLLGCADIAVAASYPGARVLGFRPIVAIRKMKGMIGSVRLADVQSGKYCRLSPGEGDLDFRAILRALNSVGYEGAVVWDIDGCANAHGDICKKTSKFVKRIRK